MQVRVGLEWVWDPAMCNREVCGIPILLPDSRFAWERVIEKEASHIPESERLNYKVQRKREIIEAYRGQLSSGDMAKLAIYTLPFVLPHLMLHDSESLAKDMVFFGHGIIITLGGICLSSPMFGIEFRAEQGQ